MYAAPMRIRGALRDCVVMLALSALCACTHTEWQAELHARDDSRPLDAEAPFLKVHMEDGALYVLSEWRVIAQPSAVSGIGLHYDVGRHVLG